MTLSTLCDPGGLRYAVPVAWDPAQYLKFADHRLRPAIDLLNRIDAADPREVCDLGAGAGNVTQLLEARVFPSLLSVLAPEGVLAVQMPRNFLAPSHTSIVDAARSGPWRAKLEPLLRPVPVNEPAFYYDLLAPRAAALDIWETEYLQVLEGEHPVKEWTKGTWLKPLLDALEEPERSGFEGAYAELVARAYPRRPDGRTLLPFRRLFMVARARG